MTAADRLEAAAHDAGAWRAFVEHALTTPTTPGVAALREVVACARAAVRPLTPAEAADGQDGRDRIALEGALARLDRALGGAPKEGT